jgi:hypothetical protein
MEMKGGGPEVQKEAAETLAIEALGFIAGEPDWLARFLAASGIGPATLRRAAADPAFLAGVLDFLLGNEPLLVAFAGRAGIPPERIGEARRALSRGAEDRRSDRDRIGARGAEDRWSDRDRIGARGAEDRRSDRDRIVKTRGGRQVRPGLDDDRPEEA